ncbi:YitT family protein [Desulfobulbus alkaliphilus]|uniref:YitT family protein n=1 Tax=Desulfobulbus alkaliphilus TaxID=869814 RepID=UPI001963ED4F|nr:YitT family protein [Desulfobulbus alkaliphilus]MBM9535588.1 YitT family protein [Desulfobulbus alkaliphilus]
MTRAFLANTVAWNILLITLGSILFSLGINGIVIHETFITGGAYGSALLIYYQTSLLSPPIWYLLINIPLFAIGWFFVSRRFFFYSLYGVIVVSICTRLIILDFHIEEQIYAAVAGGIICGAGAGITLRSLGSAGGLDILAVILNTRYNIGVGKVYFLFNVVLFGFAASLYDTPDIFIASIILVFISSVVVEYVLSMFNQRKIVYVISDHNQEISRQLNQKLQLGATYIQGRGAYSGQDKLILMTITNNLVLKKLESIVFTVDEHALFIVENSFNVIGSSFGKRKIY